MAGVLYMTKTRRVAKEATGLQKKQDLTLAQYAFLETRLGASFEWKCPHCLEAVYDRVTKGSGGYVSDDEMSNLYPIVHHSIVVPPKGHNI